ncbi:MAG: sulfatase-like hydrolase/transferase [bacterium]|nr:sulfatase-like hydrolase/transferase [bacterium]
MSPARQLVRLLFASLCGVALACSDAGQTRPPGRMILIGIDGASPRLMKPLLAQERLPNLARIASEGVQGNLRSAIPINSPRIWNTIATGKTPEKHGILSFSYRGRDAEQHLFASTDRKARTLWSIANAAGLRVGVVNFWNTYPLEKIDGVMVSDHILAKEIDGRHRMTGAKKGTVGAVIHPEVWDTRLSGMINDRATPVPDFDNPFAEDKVLPRWVLRDELQRRFDEDGALAQMALEISQDEKPDVMMVLLPGIDRISHYLWSVMEPPGTYSVGLVPTEEGRAGGRIALSSYYEYTDALIGKLTADFGPNDLVMVVSDHGFEAGEALLRLTGVHESAKALYGVLFARGPGIQPGTQARGVSVNDLAPTLLAWLRLPAARDMDGVRANFMDTTQIVPVDTYDTLALEFVTPEDVPSGVEDEVIEHLKSLGYIESE